MIELRVPDELARHLLECIYKQRNSVEHFNSSLRRGKGNVVMKSDYCLKCKTSHLSKLREYKNFDTAIETQEKWLKQWGRLEKQMQNKYETRYKKLNPRKNKKGKKK